MPMRPFPARDQLRIVFAHAAYRLADDFAARGTGIAFEQAKSPEAFEAAIPRAHVAVASGLWRNALIAKAPLLAYLQSVGVGVNNFDRPALAAAGVRFANAQGVNTRPVAEHALALMLAIVRRLPLLRDMQAKKEWRGMLGDLARREEELGGKTVAIVGQGGIGLKIADLARALEMRVLAARHDPAKGAGTAERVVGYAQVGEIAADADFLVLSCPLTEETERLVGPAVLARMKPTAWLVNVARGAVVDEPALIEHLLAGRIAGAALDVFAEEPLPQASPLWSMPNVIVTPHTAGETRHYEQRLVDILVENIERIWRGEARLRNQVG